jgi:zeaxanthin glucosyltransferase
MSHFGVMAFKGPGHMNPLIALSRQLVARGHRVTFFLEAEMEESVLQSGLEFCPLGCTKEQTTTKRRQKPSSGISVLRYRIGRIVDDMEMSLGEAPDAIKRTGIDALIIDEIALTGPTLAEMLRLPYCVISTSVPHNFGWSAPHRLSPPRSCFARVESALLEVSVFRMRGPVRLRLDRYRRRAGLGMVRDIEKSFPKFAHITQLPQCLDFPRAGLPSNFYYTGPFVDETARPPVEFPWEQLDGRPLIYASLGTTLKGDASTFHFISEACEGLDVQLIISLGGRRDLAMFQGLPGNPLVVKNAPQLELLKRADVVITHCGSNTVFETLLRGKPMIALPKVFDQPALAARLQWLGVADVLRAKGLNASKIRTAVIRVFKTPSYRAAALALRDQLISARGLERAAGAIEDALEIHVGKRATTPLVCMSGPGSSARRIIEP